MKGLNRLPQTRYFSDKDQAQRSARENLKIIMANLNDLMKVRRGAKLVQAARSLNSQKETFTPNQLSYIEGIYEKIFSAKGFDSCGLHIDRKKKGLRF